MKLQINDKIYENADNSHHINRVHKIIRTTKTLAIADTKEKFKIDIENGWCKKIGKKNIWQDIFHYKVETLELKEKFQKQRIILKLEEFDFKKLSLETLQKIDFILTKN